jgi:site-specific DNA recombinase
MQDQETLVGLSKYLLQLGLKSPRGKRCWSSATLRGLLSNPTYTGNVYVDRQRLRPARRRRSATHPLGKPAAGRDPAPPEEWTLVTPIPALVSQADFDAVQAKLDLNQQRASRNNTVHSYLLRALVSCARCQSACTALTSYSGHGYYRCWRSVQGFGAQSDARCHARYSPADQLDALVWQDLCELLAHPEWIAYALERAHGGHWLPQALQARKETLHQAQTALAHQLDRLTEAYLREVIPLAEYQRRRQDLEQKQHALAAQEEQLEVQVDRQDKLAGMVTSIEAFCQRVRIG